MGWPVVVLTSMGIEDGTLRSGDASRLAPLPGSLRLPPGTDEEWRNLIARRREAHALGPGPRGTVNLPPCRCPVVAGRRGRLGRDRRGRPLLPTPYTSSVVALPTGEAAECKKPPEVDQGRGVADDDTRHRTTGPAICRSTASRDSSSRPAARGGEISSSPTARQLVRQGVAFSPTFVGVDTITDPRQIVA